MDLYQVDVVHINLIMICLFDKVMNFERLPKSKVLKLTNCLMNYCYKLDLNDIIPQIYKMHISIWLNLKTDKLFCFQKHHKR